ncbi:TVP38/TMEM64 family protein [Acidisphaera rubrifaciens]|uniref:TVP38/TMEM64 family membrane protein n=1 Tax=Acidisphaera rubrifaciens HS-AP3 TaxID=1231350 RepID=A0A0D6P7T9_9PROT|nr:VTT domain-containing protein [Acidisphaera rubrifaciens]GAN77411.1 hypothetical protein Asru_0303_14 [Acidisphaera rubrifaciens HS-AP3]
MPTAQGRARWHGWGRGLGLLAGLLAVGLTLRQGSQLNAGFMNRIAHRADLLGVTVYLGFGALLCTMGVPRQTTAFAAGYAFAPRFGLGVAVLLSLGTQLAGCAANFFWARWVAGAWVRRRLPPRLRRLDASLAGQPFRATLVLRLLPLGSNIALNLIGGVSTVRLGPFLAASAIGYLPQTLIFALLGRGTQVGGRTEIALAAALFAASGLLGVRLMARRPKQGPVSAG